MEKIGYEQLRDCQRILVERADFLTKEEEELLKEIKSLVGLSRNMSYCDFTYELVQALDGNKSESANLIRSKYFPTPEYDPSRE